MHNSLFAVAGCLKAVLRACAALVSNLLLLQHMFPGLSQGSAEGDKGLRFIKVFKGQGGPAC